MTLAFCVFEGFVSITQTGDGPVLAGVFLALVKSSVLDETEKILRFRVETVASTP